MYLLILLLAIQSHVSVWFYVVFSIVFAFKAVWWYAKWAKRYNEQKGDGQL